MSAESPVRVGVLVSGNGTNLQALIDAVAAGELNVQIVLVISNRPGVPALERARKAGIPALVLDPSRFASREAFDEAAAKALLHRGAEIVVLAGFMRRLTQAFLEHFPDRVLNLHPALLPENPEQDEVRLPDGTLGKVFRGLHVIEQALSAGVRWTGCTVHLATADLDRGPVVKCRAVPVLPGDTAETLRRRIQATEHRILPQAVAECARRISRNLGPRAGGRPGSS